MGELFAGVWAGEHHRELDMAIVNLVPGPSDGSDSISRKFERVDAVGFGSVGVPSARCRRYLSTLPYRCGLQLQTESVPVL